MTTTSGVRPLALASAHAYAERPLFLRAGDETLFAVLTTPAIPATRAVTPGVLLLHNGMMTMGQNRLWPRTARALAGAGIPSLRLDLHGGGDSTGVPHDREATGQSLVDVRVGVKTLLAAGADRIVVAGRCWAGLVGLVAAADIAAVTALALVSPPLQSLLPGPAAVTSAAEPHADLRRIARTLATAETLRLLRDAEYRHWLTRRGLRRLGVGASGPPSSGRLQVISALRARDVKLHALYGSEDAAWAALHATTSAPLRIALGENLLTRQVPGDVHFLRTTQAQDHVLRLVVDVATGLG